MTTFCLTYHTPIQLKLSIIITILQLLKFTWSLIGKHLNILYIIMNWQLTTTFWIFSKCFHLRTSKKLLMLSWLSTTKIRSESISPNCMAIDGFVGEAAQNLCLTRVAISASQLQNWICTRLWKPTNKLTSTNMAISDEKLITYQILTIKSSQFEDTKKIKIKTL